MQHGADITAPGWSWTLRRGSLMGASASVPESLGKEQAKALAGDKWDEAAFDAAADDGQITSEQFNAALRAHGAERAYREAISVDPKNVEARYNLGILLQHERNDVDGAERAYRDAIEVDPRCAVAHHNLGLLLQHERRDVDGAKRAYLKAAAAGLDEATFHGAMERLATLSVNLGLLQLEGERKDVDGAERAYRKAIEVDAKCAMAHYQLGHLLRHERKDVDGAERAYRKAMEIDRKYQV